MAQAAILLIGLAALLGPSLSVASDDDEQPVYMIYIDPETGKYTTHDPLAADRDQPVPAAMPTESSNAASALGAPGQIWYAAVTAVLVILLLLVGRRMLVRHSSSH